MTDQYPPPPSAMYPPPPPAPTKKKPFYKKWWVWTIVILVILAAAASGGGSKDKKTEAVASATTVAAPAVTVAPAPVAPEATVPPAPAVAPNGTRFQGDDITIESCDPGQFGTQVKLRLVNNSSKQSNYLISLKFEDAAGTQVGNGFASANNVNPGQTALVDGYGTGTGVTKCIIADVTRYAS